MTAPVERLPTANFLAGVVPDIPWSEFEEASIRSASETQTVRVVDVEPLLVAIYPQAAELLGGVSRSTMYALAASGDLETVQVLGRRMIPLDALRAYVARLRAERAG